MQSAPQSLCIVHSGFPLRSLTDCVVFFQVNLATLSHRLIEICVLIFVTRLHPPAAATAMCTDFSFKCKSGKCISKVNAECDRVKDCADGTDEEGCSKTCFTLFPPPPIGISISGFLTKTAKSVCNHLSAIQSRLYVHQAVC